MSFNIRYLVIGDFLFSFIFSNFMNFKIPLFKLSRSYYINCICLRASMYEKLDIIPKLYLLIHKRLLIGLSILNILEKTSFKSKKKKK